MDTHTHTHAQAAFIYTLNSEYELQSHVLLTSHVHSTNTSILSDLILSWIYSGSRFTRAGGQVKMALTVEHQCVCV